MRWRQQQVTWDPSFQTLFPYRMGPPAPFHTQDPILPRPVAKTRMGGGDFHVLQGRGGVSPLLHAKVYLKMCSSVTITCPTWLLPSWPSRTHSQASSHGLIKTHSRLDEVRQRCRHPNSPSGELVPSPSRVSNEPCAYRSPHQQGPWILPPTCSWHPPTSLHHHGNHLAPAHSLARAAPGASSRVSLLLVCPPPPPATICSQYSL